MTTCISEVAWEKIRNEYEVLLSDKNMKEFIRENGRYVGYIPMTIAECSQMSGEQKMLYKYDVYIYDGKVYLTN